MTAQAESETRKRVSTTTHIRIDIAGCLRNNTVKQLKGMFTDSETGRDLSGKEAQKFLISELSKGHKYLPAGDCPDFDPMSGCPGHPVYEDKEK